MKSKAQHRLKEIYGHKLFSTGIKKSVATMSSTLHKIRQSKDIHTVCTWQFEGLSHFF
jgi:hypothetical protein